MQFCMIDNNLILVYYQICAGKGNIWNLILTISGVQYLQRHTGAHS